MIKHIVTWKLDESYSSTEKEEKIKALAEKLMGLEGKIDSLRSISVNYNSIEAPTSNYDLILDTSFDSMDDLMAYQVHPRHVEVVEFMKTFKKERACIDYEI